VTARKGALIGVALVLVAVLAVLCARRLKKVQ
jgi:hypothetical protein